VGRLSPASDASPAAWIVGSLTTFAESVLSLVPAGFAAYVRIFHPAYRGTETSTVLVRWAEIAEANGARAHAGMQLPALTGSFRYEENGQPLVFDHPPHEGTLPGDLAERVAALLVRHTATPNRCWFAFWYGFGDLPEKIRRAPAFETPGREYRLLHGPVEALMEAGFVQSGGQSPNLWWPEDHAWCVATEIDLKTTYIGCTGQCRDELLADGGLEALTIDPGARIDYLSDGINPPPRRD
jgi:hypothetical protein